MDAKEMREKSHGKPGETVPTIQYAKGFKEWDEALKTGQPLPPVDVALVRRVWEAIRAEAYSGIVFEVGPNVWTRAAALNDLVKTFGVELSDGVFEEAAVFPWCNTSKHEDFVRHLENKKGVRKV